MITKKTIEQQIAGLDEKIDDLETAKNKLVKQKAELMGKIKLLPKYNSKTAKTVKRLIDQTAKLIKGETNHFLYKGLKVSYNLIWMSDFSPEIDGYEVKFPTNFKPETPIEELFFQYFKNNLTDYIDSNGLHDDIIKAIEKDKGYLDFSKRIKDICKESDDLEAKQQITDFDTDILSPAEKKL